MRQRLSDDIKTAMKSGDKPRLATLRLISAAFKQADIDAQMAGKSVLDDAGLIGVLTRMVKQRRDSIQQFTAGGRPELAAAEAAEITVIEHYLPRQLSADEVTAALTAAIKETGAAGLKDMGKVMGLIKERFAGQIDAAAVSTRVRDLLK
jgi:hypothetical protein